jgi:DNA-binding MarR family transcriptional regulator
VVDGVAELGSEQERAWELYVRSHALLERALDAELRAEQGMSLHTLDALVQLSRAPGRAMYMKNLAAALAYSASGITRIVDNLERSGHVTRQPDPANRRATLVNLTPQGCQALKSASVSYARMVQHRFARHIDAGQAKVLVDVFSAMADDLAPPAHLMKR